MSGGKEKLKEKMSHRHTQTNTDKKAKRKIHYNKPGHREKKSG